jgi:subtilisin family serine protease
MQSNRRRIVLAAQRLLAGLIGTVVMGVSPVHAGAVSEALAYGIPSRHVSGVALIKFKDVHVKRIQLPRKSDVVARGILHEVEARAGIAVQLDKAGPLGYGLYRIRDAKSPGPKSMPTEEETLRMILRLQVDPAVEKIAPDTWHRPFLVPNDSYYPDMWHLEMIHAGSAWNIATGNSAQRVGVIDTGLIRNHEDLQTKDAYGYDFISSSDIARDGDGRDSDYTDEGDGGYCPGFGNMPDSWHGTHVSGTILAATNNNKGIAGINWTAQLVTARALGHCGGDSFDIMSGALWLTGYSIDDVPTLPAEHRVSVMNLSLGSPTTCSSFEQESIDAINSRDAVFVAATGNDGGAVGSPANSTGVISVAAVGPNGNLASYSSFGGEVEVVAPGGDGSYAEDGIASASGPNSNDYMYQQGTSMAAPQVAGAISLVQAIDPSLTGYQEIRDVLNQGVSCGNCSNVPVLRLDLMLQDVDPSSTPGETPGSGTDPDDAYEENDSFDTAAWIECGDELELFAAPLDYDFFAFESVEGTPVEVTLSADSGADLDLYWVKGMDFPQDVLEGSESPTGNETIGFNSTGERMVVLVNPWYNQQTNNANSDSYHLSLDCEAGDTPPSGNGGDNQEGIDPDSVDDDDLEDNDGAEMAQRISCDETGEYVLHDDDWYVVRLDDNANLSVTTEATHAAAAIEIRNAENQQMIAAQSTGTDLRQFARAEGLTLGDHLIRIRYESQSTLYTMEVACIAEGVRAENGCRHLHTKAANGPGVWSTILALLWFWGLGKRRRR